MTLYLKKTYNHANSYYTNWHYLRNMTSLQVELLQGMEWYEYHMEIYTLLWGVPWVEANERAIKVSTKGFIGELNSDIMRL